jgi:hypothetical protein
MYVVVIKIDLTYEASRFLSQDLLKLDKFGSRTSTHCLTSAACASLPCQR